MKFAMIFSSMMSLTGVAHAASLTIGCTFAQIGNGAEQSHQVVLPASVDFGKPEAKGVIFESPRLEISAIVHPGTMGFDIRIVDKKSGVQSSISVMDATPGQALPVLQLGGTPEYDDSGKLVNAHGFVAEAACGVVGNE